MRVTHYSVQANHVHMMVEADDQQALSRGMQGLGIPDRLAALVAMRNPAAHGERASRESVSAAREEVLGIGAEGLVPHLARVRLRG